MRELMTREGIKEEKKKKGLGDTLSDEMMTAINNQGNRYNDAIDEVLIIINSKIENLLDDAFKDYDRKEEIKETISEIREIKRIVKKLKKRDNRDN